MSAPSTYDCALQNMSLFLYLNVFSKVNGHYHFGFGRTTVIFRAEVPFRGTIIQTNVANPSQCTNTHRNVRN
jgi:hypothetical protein